MLYLKRKQKQVVDLVNNPKIHTIVLLGTVGTGKTDIAAHISISIAYTFPKTYWTVFRQNLSVARRSVIPSYINMLDMMNLIENVDYKFDKQIGTISFLHNKSRIEFIEADYSKDREGKKIKGINASGNHIDEADELHQVMFIQALSRRGRRNENGQPSLSIITMNPNDTHLKDLYYRPFRENTLPDGVAIVEFGLEDSWQSMIDIEAMKKNPKPWVERYLYNNWDYQDDLDSLFKYKYFDSAIIKELNNASKRYIGYDVARSGGDRSVIAEWWGKTLVNIEIVKSSNESITTDEQAKYLIKYMTLNGVLPENTTVDTVGIGVGVVDFMKSRGINVREFMSGNSSTNGKYNNLRSQVIYEFAQGLERGEIKIYEGCSFRNELIAEAMLHRHKVTDKILQVESKDEIKKRAGGLSPDIFDAVVMGLHPQLNIDIRNDYSRIVF